MSSVRLTTLSHGAGCACKLASAELNSALSQMSVTGLANDPNVLVGFDTADDAGVYRIADDLALVQSVDFFTPIVDDARTWGRVAATNALSDLYAMGAMPKTALNLVAWPRDSIGFDVLAQVLDGGGEVLAAAGCSLIGGHSIDDAEPKYGAAVTGVVDPRRMLTNAGARPGDVLVLTKPLGTGVITTALKREVCPDDAYEAAVASMTTLNAAAAAIGVEADVNAATDITGYGLVGHLSEMLRASSVAAKLDLGALPVLPQVRRLIEDDVVPGGTQRNLDDTAHVAWNGADQPARILACDAQTSGGLLLSVAADTADLVQERLLEAGTLTAARVGTIVEHDADRLIDVEGA